MKKTKILAIDDEPQNTQIMKEILSFHHKYELALASSGSEALRLMQSFSPDIVLLDIMMPEMDGYEVCRKIRKDHNNQYAKVIMVSGLSMISDRLEGYRAGADDYLTKPFVEDELIAKLEVYSKLARMEEVDHLKTIALNILSHETRTPLNGIILGCEMLKDVEGVPPKVATYADMLRTSGLRIKTIVDRIGLFCSLREGVRISQNTLLLRTIIDEVIKNITWEECSIRIECRFEDDFSIIADENLIVMVLQALLDNAVRHSPLNGTVNISAEKREKTAVIKVLDEGEGFPEKMLEHTFSGLFTTDILHHTDGIGLSLAISKEVIELHGGSITCSNRREGGALFEIILPYVKNET